jgi:hypothetical protein
MEKKLTELIGQPNVWLYIKSSNGWIKNVEIINVNSETITFRYEQESDLETKVWEKTTRMDNILEVDVRFASLPKCKQKIEEMRNKFTKLLEQD